MWYARRQGGRIEIERQVAVKRLVPIILFVLVALVQPVAGNIPCIIDCGPADGLIYVFALGIGIVLGVILLPFYLLSRLLSPAP